MPAPIPNLRAKLDLLAPRYPKGEMLARAIRHQDDMSKSMDQPMLSRAKDADRLPYQWVRGLLTLYGLPLPEKLDSSDPVSAPWFDLCAEPDLDAFIARVRLMGGEVDGEPSGAVWDSFLSARSSQATSSAAQCLAFNRLDDRQSRHYEQSARALPIGHWAKEEPHADTPQLRAGERISLTLSLGNLLTPRPQRFHILCFLEVRDGDKRLALPLVPAPAICGIQMPAPYSDDSVFEIPQNPSKTNCLEVDAGWDERAFVVLVTNRKLDDMLLEDTLEDGPILRDRLDLIAARLKHPKQWAPGSWALMRGGYHVLNNPV